MSTVSHANLLRLIEHYFWGDGSDGAITQSGGAATGDGVFNYTQIYLSAGATYGPAAARVGFYRVKGKTKLVGNSNLQARGDAGTGGGAAVNNAVGITAPSISAATWIHIHRMVGGGGLGAGGGGDGAGNAGGNGGVNEWERNTAGRSILSEAQTGGVGGAGAGGAGATSVAEAYFSDIDHNMAHEQFGCPGTGGGSGGADGAGTSGAGGAGGDAGGCLIIQCPHIEVEAGSSINCNGEDGVAGDNATVLNAGGGAGGGGAGAGALYVLCLDIDNVGNITATGGTGGAGGAGLGTGGAGGLGGDGADGILAINELGLL